MHFVYLFRHSSHADDELRFSLRSVARHASWVRKVWIFGDRPAWLSDNHHIIEHIPHEAIAWVIGCQTPVVNMFMMLYLIALLPDVSPEFLLFCDDYILLDDLTPEIATRIRYLEDLDTIAHNRGTGVYKTALWRTYDALKQHGYPRLNYEAHLPTYHTQRRILAAVREFRSHITEDRFLGLLANLAILNHAQKHDGFTPISLREEDSYAGFHYRQHTFDEIRTRCRGKRFLNFDDTAYNSDMQRYLARRFPIPCIYEQNCFESSI